MRLRIAMISEHASPLAALGGVDAGGQNVYVAQLAMLLARRGHHVDVFTRRDDCRLAPVVQLQPRLRVIHVPAGPACQVRKEDLYRHMPQFASFMIGFILDQEGGYDLIHANFWMSGFVGLQIKRKLNIPLVVTFHALGRLRRLHQGARDEFPVERLAVEDDIVAEADRIVAECPQEVDDLLTHYRADLRRISMVPCGFDPIEMRPVGKATARARLGLPERELILLQLGRMVPRKGVDNAIRGFAGFVRRTGMAARLVVVGGDSDEPDPVLTPELGRLQQVAAEEGVQDRVLFTGSRSRDVLRYYYSAADIFLTTPWYEPFGITPLEAMACGAVVIASNVGGLKFSVKDGRTGFLVPPNDTQALVERITWLAESPSLLRAFSARGRKRVLRYFQWEHIAMLMERCYDQSLLQTAGVVAPRRSSRRAELADDQSSTPMLTQ